MEELAPDQPVFLLLTPSIRVPFFARTLMRGGLRFQPPDVTSLKPASSRARPNLLEGSEN
jgi:uncharacterized membrane protein